MFKPVTGLTCLFFVLISGKHQQPTVRMSAMIKVKYLKTLSRPSKGYV